jgi:hypothetical protein
VPGMPPILIKLDPLKLPQIPSAVLTVVLEQ